MSTTGKRAAIHLANVLGSGTIALLQWNLADELLLDDTIPPSCSDLYGVPVDCFTNTVRPAAALVLFVILVTVCVWVEKRRGIL